ncbi:hypothetical protein [Micromonospora sp. WMMD1082]|uniref:hypothetical protein n=1 Tax=Micromonospora sp. WMMD1082 TaxID=3016104 RepID=UPI002415C010|nr:hypothetical protein [Micromonospora sp. WMMD1082]MDG4795397.1 hypothetical protein [Micromonospora sp. WMMD1082]
MNQADRWLPLVVNEGQPVRGEGFVLRVGETHCLLAVGGTALTSDGTIVSAAPTAMLHPATFVDLDRFEGRHTVIDGRLENSAVRVLGVNAVEPQADVHYVNAATRPDHRTIRVRSQAERQLMTEGLLLDLWHPADTEPSRPVALATDPEPVREALIGDYGKHLTVVKSRWTEATLRHIEEELNRDGLVRSVGRRIGPNLQMQVDATLLHIPASLPLRLARFPADAIHIHPILTPRAPAAKSLGDAE